MTERKSDMDKKTKRFTKAAVAFVVVVAVCTFFSKSFYNYRIPTVTVTSPKQGNLSLSVKGNTEIGYSSVSAVYCDVDGRVKCILVEAGEEVSAGQTVMQFEAPGTGEVVDMTAKWEGIITRIGVDEGMYVSSMQNTVLYQIAEKSSEWTAYLLISDEQRELVDFDSVPVFQIEGVSGPITGTIDAVTAYADYQMSGWQIRMLLESEDGNLAGRHAEVTINNELQPYDVLIPASALRKDVEGYYVLVLREDQSVLGRGYVAHRMSVELLDSDQEYCAVRGLPTDEQVILTATDVIGDGSSVYYGGAGAR